MVRPLKDPAFFARVFVELGALTWPNGFGLDPIALHHRMSAAGELGRESGGAASAAAGELTRAAE
jgi:hypothetical protein